MAKIEWRCTFAVYRHFLQCGNLLKAMVPGEDDYEAVAEEIRGLPGFPRNYDWERDLIVVDPYKEYIIT